jgi:hypothetical protein
VRRFGSPHELAAEVVSSSVDLKFRHPAVGFIRTDQVVEFKKYAAVLEEKDLLNEQLRSLRGQLNPEFRGSDESIKIEMRRASAHSGRL